MFNYVLCSIFQFHVLGAWGKKETPQKQKKGIQEILIMMRIAGTRN